MYDITIRTEVEDTNLIRVRRYLVRGINRNDALNTLAQLLNVQFSTLSISATVHECYTNKTYS